MDEGDIFKKDELGVCRGKTRNTFVSVIYADE